MGPTKELIDEIFRARILHARATQPEQRIIDAFDLFAMGCEITKSGIRAQNPGADESEVQRILEQRLALGRRLDGATRQ